MKKLIFGFTMARSRSFIREKYGSEFWKSFRTLAKMHFNNILPKVPDIGYSIFSFNYKFGASYIAWYKSFFDLGLSQDEAIENIWKMNEKMVTAIPSPLMHSSGKAYINSFRKKAKRHEERQKRGELHPYDWKVVFRDIDKNTFEIDIIECAMKKLAHDFNADGLLPGICRMDYLFSSVMGNGFTRTKTLGDGDDCCNCRYELEGSCEWAPENGFIYRK